MHLIVGIFPVISGDSEFNNHVTRVNFVAVVFIHAVFPVLGCYQFRSPWVSGNHFLVLEALFEFLVALGVGY